MWTCQGGAPALASVEVKPEIEPQNTPARGARPDADIAARGPEPAPQDEGRADNPDREPHRGIRHIGREQSAGGDTDQSARNQDFQIPGIPMPPVGPDRDHILHQQDRQHDRDRLQRRNDQREQWRCDHADAGEAALGKAKQRHGNHRDRPEQGVGGEGQGGLVLRRIKPPPLRRR